MCNRLSELEAALGRYVASFDAATLEGEAAAWVARVGAGIEKLGATLKALAAVRAAETGTWKGSGERSAAAQLARITGSSVSSAAEALETARRLESLPVAAEAARGGALSGAQASAISAAAQANPAAESRLVELAARTSLAELRDECARVRAAASDAEARREAIHASRYLRTYVDAEGAGNLRMRDNPEVVAEVMAAIEPIRDRLFTEARTEGRREPPDAYGADAMRELAGGGSEPGSQRGRAKVIVRVDLDALLRGHPGEGEVCEVAGYGPIAASAVQDLLDTGDPFLTAVVTRGEAVVGVAHLGRRPTAVQETALEWLYPTCAVEGCSAVARLQTDHRVEWSATRLTVFDLLDRLCPHHHRLKTIEGWGLIAGRGKRPFVAPDDARHPRRAQANAPPVPV